jgi:uncharacterized protein (PEP-CTERM system associated)
MRGALAAALCALLPWPTAAQDAGTPARAWAIEPNVFLRATYSDNYRQLPVKESDVITEAGAGLRITGTGGRIRGFFDYSLTGTAHSRHSESNDLRHRLSAATTAEVVDGFAFIDAQASYTRQAVSAFGVQTSTSILDTENQTDVASLSISPSLRGRIGPSLRYAARASYAATRAKDSDDGDLDVGSAALTLDGGAPGGNLGWKALASHTVSDYLAGRRTFDSRLLAGVSYLFTRELKVGVTAGAERTDVQVLDGETTSTAGLEVEWTPTERTLLSGIVEKRYFGTGHSIQFSHRTPRTAWTASVTRDVSTPGASATGGFGSAYDLFFRQFASTEADPVKRDVLVRTFLRNNNIDPNAVVVGGFLASALTLEQAQSASFALVGVRNTVTLRASRSRSERIDDLAVVADDLSVSDTVTQHGISLDWAYRLTPVSAINVTAGYQRSKGDATTQETTLKTLAVGWAAPFGPRSTVSAGARHAVFDSATAPYKENAIFGAVRFAF